MSGDPANFEGHEPRECGEHRSVGSHRAWCYECNEWCYPKAPCKGCELAQLRAVVAKVGGIVADYFYARFQTGLAPRGEHVIGWIRDALPDESVQRSTGG